LWEEGVIAFEAYEKFMLDETGDYIPPKTNQNLNEYLNN